MSNVRLLLAVFGICIMAIGGVAAAGIASAVVAAFVTGLWKIARAIIGG